MKTIDPHSLLGKPRTIENGGVISELFTIWKSLMNEKTDSNISEFDGFVAGYFLGTNAMLREKYMKLKPKDEVYNVK